MNDYNFTDEEQAEFDKFVQHARESSVKGMLDSAFVASIYPSTGEPDIKYAMELGLAIMLNKPILVVCTHDTPLPPKLEALADEVVYADIDLEEGRERLGRAIEKMQRRLRRDADPA